MVVTKEKLNKYTNRVYGKLVTDLKDNRKVFEALSEVIGEEYPESEDMEKVKTEFEKSSEENLNDFFEAKMNPATNNFKCCKFSSNTRLMAQLSWR